MGYGRSWDAAAHRGSPSVHLGRGPAFSPEFTLGAIGTFVQRVPVE